MSSSKARLPHARQPRGLMVEPQTCEWEGGLWLSGEEGPPKGPQLPEPGHDRPLSARLPAPEHGTSPVLLTFVTECWYKLGARQESAE